MFCEIVYFVIPVRRRAKRELKQGERMYPGTTMHSNKCNVGLRNGHVTRARGIARVRQNQRWDSGMISRITATPARPHGGLDGNVLEGYDNPHIRLDHAELEVLEREDVETHINLPPILRHGRA